MLTIRAVESNFSAASTKAENVRFKTTCAYFEALFKFYPLARRVLELTCGYVFMNRSYGEGCQKILAAFRDIVQKILGKDQGILGKDL